MCGSTVGFNADPMGRIVRRYVVLSLWEWGLSSVRSYSYECRSTDDHKALKIKGLGFDP